MQLKKNTNKFLTLWSTDNGTGVFPLYKTALESPEFATIIWLGQMTATTAVEPAVSGAIG